MAKTNPNAAAGTPDKSGSRQTANAKAYLHNFSRPGGGKAESSKSAHTSQKGK